MIKTNPKLCGRISLGFLFLTILLNSACTNQVQATKSTPTSTIQEPTTMNSTPSNHSYSSTSENSSDSVQKYLQDLNSSDENVRVQAAQNLQKMGQPQALKACLKTINDAPDPLHLDMTPGVQCLRNIGKPALPPLLDYLNSEDEMTRMRAEKAVLWISKLYFGFDGQQWATDGLDVWSEWWQTIGYDAEATPAQRTEAVQRMKTWFANQ
ncbi:MAG: HEAT repeat domain-containing protein [Coleofasciculus sp. G1-WW12-02]|uniref:HEAT repeat domain-containing protein n=1 Tax=Coleofasciculus sp. G1-WW12-02 TaxID=3068483 RepID=UPI0032F5CA6E